MTNNLIILFDVILGIFSILVFISAMKIYFENEELEKKIHKSLDDQIASMKQLNKEIKNKNRRLKLNLQEFNQDKEVI